MISRKAVGLAWLALLCLWLASGCYSSESRVAYHNERGRAFLEEEKLSSAEVEFRAAVSFDPGNVESNLALADLAEKSGRIREAKFYLREILFVTPENAEVAVRLATLLRDDQPLEARRLLLQTIKHSPGDPAAYLGMSQIEVWSKQYEDALARVKKALELDPSLPGAWWQQGIVYQGMMQHSLESGGAIDEATRRAAVDAFEKFIEAGGEPVWKARLEQAEILSAGSYNVPEAIAAAKRALDAARREEGDAPKLEVATHLARVAQRTRDRAAYAEALEVVLEVHPRDFRSWRNLAEMRGASGGDAEAVYRRLLAMYPDDPEAHILYSKHIGTSQGVWMALRYFDEQIDAGIDPPQMLSALRSYQVAYRLWNHAGRTLERLQTEYPSNPWTRLEEAKKAAEDGRSLAAITILEEVVAEQEIVEAYDVLAKLERFHERPRRALRAIERAVELDLYYNPLLHKTLAELRFENRDYAGYLEAVDRIAQHDELTPREELDRARALYATGKRSDGRDELIRLATHEEVGSKATIDFIRFEGNEPDNAVRARRLLLQALAREPANKELITARVELELRMNRNLQALEILEDLHVEEYPPNVPYLRSRLRAEAGNTEGALADVDLALRSDPSTQDVADFALLLYSQSGEVEPHLQKLSRWIESMRANPTVEWLENSRRIAKLQLLRSRLLHVEGRNDEAIDVLEDAIANYEYTGESRIDLAYLLVITERSPKRAIEIGLELVDKQGTHPRALDALGFAYLSAEEPVDALTYIRKAIINQPSPNALFHYHESLALRELGRRSEALKAIKKVLGLDPRYPRAVELKRELEAEIARG